MLGWFRSRASGIATLAMLSMTAVGGLAVVPHQDDCHDNACMPIAVQHNAAAHRIDGAFSDGVDHHTQHCLVCHWIRAFRPRTESRIVSGQASRARVRIPVTLLVLSGRAPVAQPPLRSPPSSLLS